VQWTGYYAQEFGFKDAVEILGRRFSLTFWLMALVPALSSLSKDSSSELRRSVAVQIPKFAAFLASMDDSWFQSAFGTLEASLTDLHMDNSGEVRLVCFCLV
jgi:hypothetical protein